jgi:hypothetical protein
VKQRRKKYKDISSIEFLLQRDTLGIKRYRKTARRDPEKREILLTLGLMKIKEQEENNFIPIGYRKRRIEI